MKAIVIDDHEEIRETIKSIILKSGFNIEVFGEANGVVSGLKLIKAEQPELIFLDVEMGDGTGFDLLTLLDDTKVKVIFVTSHDDFAIKAFKFSAIDYVLKPIDPSDLLGAISKAIRLPQTSSKIETLLANQKTEKPKLVLSDQKNTFLVDITDIIRCEAEANYTTFFLIDNKKILVSKTLKSYEQLLEDYGFFRTHQSHLINLHYFDRYDRSEGGAIYLKNGDCVPIATRKKEAIVTRLNSFLK